MRMWARISAFENRLATDMCAGLNRLADGLNRQPPMTWRAALSMFVMTAVLALCWWLVSLLVLYVHGGPFGG